MKELKEFFVSPETVIKKAKKEKNLNKTVGYQILVSVIFAVASYLIGYTANFLYPETFAITCFILGFLGMLFAGYLATIVMNVLGGRGKYFEGLTAVVYTMVPPSIGTLILALLSYVQQLTWLGVIAVIITSAMGYAIFYRSLKELFRTDMITAFLGTGVIVFSILIGVYTYLLIAAMPKIFATNLLIQGMA